MKKIFALLLVLCMALSLLTGCQKNSVLTAEDAIKVVLEDLDVSADKASEAHVHIATGDVPAYSIYITVGDVNYSYLIAVADGEILDSEILSEAHTH